MGTASQNVLKKTFADGYVPNIEICKSFLSLFAVQYHCVIALCVCRWRCQSVEEHSEHERKVAYRGMLEAITHGRNLPRRALRRLKVTSIEAYAKAVATNINGESI